MVKHFAWKKATWCERALAAAVAMVLMAFGLAACSGANGEGDAVGEKTYAEVAPLPQTGFSEAVPVEYQRASSEPGSVQRIDYDMLDYAGNRSAITKTAYVYTPYGYDADDTETRYDVLYLMHGWGGHAGEYFEYSNLKNMLDSLIEHGDMPPTIIVSATFYHDGSGTDFSGSVAEKNLNERGYFVYEGVGTNDSVKSQTLMQMEEMFARGDTFPAEHVVFYQKEGGYHDFDAVQEFLYNALPHFFLQTKAGEGAGAESEEDPFSPLAVYTRDTPIDDVINDEALGAWGRLLFPVQTSYMSGTTLGNLELAWYNNIDPDMTVEVCNYVRGRADSGDTVFIDIYTDAEKAADPAKANTGLVFFRGDAGAKTAIVNAGGGFSYVGAMHDSFPHCLELAKRGYNAFALIYRPGSQTACEDLARAIAYLHDHADELVISMEGYSLWGGSAGGRMADWLGTYGTESFDETAYPRPAACIVNYTGLSEVTGAEPPTYSAVGTDDGIANWHTMQSRIERIQANGTDVQIEVFDGLRHGFGLGTGTVAQGWLDRAVEFWERQR